MRSSDWQPMETAPLNPYGKAYGPTVLIWCTATGTPIPAYYAPMHGWTCRDTGPAWLVDDGIGDPPIAPEDAAAWMPIAAPWSEAPTPKATIEKREENGRFLKPSDDTTPVEFMRWFRKNYPGPDTIIFRPDWHAPRIWRAALRSMPVSPAQRWFAALTQDREELVGILRELLAGDATRQDQRWRLAMERARQFIKTEDDET